MVYAHGIEGTVHARAAGSRPGLITSWVVTLMLVTFTADVRAPDAHPFSPK
jgi:hypothetical protein